MIDLQGVVAFFKDILAGQIVTSKSFVFSVRILIILDIAGTSTVSPFLIATEPKSLVMVAEPPTHFK